MAKVLEVQLQYQSFQWIFRVDWLDLLAVQGTLKSLLQHHSSKASVLLCWAFFMIQLSHLCMATGENMAFTSQTFVRKVMSLLLKTLSRFDIALSSTCHYLCTICLLIYHLSIYVSICVSIIVNLSIDHLCRYLSFCVSIIFNWFELAHVTMLAGKSQTCRADVLVWGPSDK